MLKAFRYLFWLALGVILLAVASANREPVTLRLLPPELDQYLGLGWQIDMPLFLVVFAGILAGLFIGFVWEWLRAAPVRTAATQHRRRVGHLERELGKLKEPQVAERDEVLAILDGKAH